MAKTTLKRSLYIGLGGTGISALLHTKKHYMELYGEIPPMIGFLSLDTDKNDHKKFLNCDGYGQISLEENEKLSISVEEPLPIYHRNQEKFNWLSRENLRALKSMVAGAGQVRTNGRFAFTVNKERIESKVKSAINSITNARITDNVKYQADNDTNINIHLIFSICGGTGCGTFINMASLIRELEPKCKLIGYAILPEVFRAMSNSGTANVGTNAYAALLDLDYIMSQQSDKSIDIQYLNRTEKLTGYPFNVFYMIDNETQDGTSYTSVESLTEMLSLALLTSAEGNASGGINSFFDNIETSMGSSDYDIFNKRGWVSGLGTTEIIYHGDSLRHIYALKAAERLINMLINSTKNADDIANSWIDSPDVKIRENHGSDDLIDYLLKPTNEPQFKLNLNDIKDKKDQLKNIIDQTINANEDHFTKVAKKAATEKLTTVSEKLKELLKNNINSDGGVLITSQILKLIKAQLVECKKEMDQELDSFNIKMGNLNTNLTNQENKLLSILNKPFLFFKSTEIATTQKECDQKFIAVIKNKREIIRRLNASDIFARVIEMVDDYNNNVQRLLDTLILTRDNLITKIASEQNKSSYRSKLFQIDLAENELNNITVDDKHIAFSDFIKNKDLLSLSELKAEHLENFFYDYTANLNEAKKFSNRTIDDAINALPSNKFDELLRKIALKSQALTKYDLSGYFLNAVPINNYFVGVPDKENSKLKENDNFKKAFSDDTNVAFTSIGSTDRVIVYHLTGVYPAFAVAAMATFKDEYDRAITSETAVSPHFGKQMEVIMEREQWQLMPTEEKDDDILNWWVMGFLFDLIKNTEKGYAYQCKKIGNPLNGYWVELPKYRDEAYNDFKTNKAIIQKEFNDYFTNLIKQKGTEAVKIDFINKKNSYWNNESGEGCAQINMNSNNLLKRENKTIADLFEKELKLLETLDPQNIF